MTTLRTTTTMTLVLLVGVVGLAFAPTAAAEGVCLGEEPYWAEDPGYQVGVDDDCGFHSCDGVNVLVMMEDECSGGCEGVTVIGPLTSDSCGDPDETLRSVLR